MGHFFGKSAAGGAPGYAFVETQEIGGNNDSQGEGGWDNPAWNSSHASNTPGYTTSPAPLAGTKSVQVAAFKTISHDFASPGANANLYFILNIAAAGVINNETFVEFQDVSSATVALLRYRSGDIVRGSCGSVNSAEGGSLAPTVTRHCWVEYENHGSGSSVLRFFTAANATKPPTPDVTAISTGTSSTNATKFILGGLTGAVVFDNIVADTSQVIGSNPVP